MRSAAARYGWAVVAVFLATAARLVVDRALSYHHPYSSFYVAVLIVAWYGGLGPGLLTTFLGAGSIAFVVPAVLRYLGASSLGGPGLEFYFIVAITANILFEAQRLAVIRSERHARLAQESLDRLRSETEQRQLAEESSREAQEQLQLTYQNAPVGICRLAPDGRFLEVNPRLCAVTGYARDELLGRGIQTILYPDERESFRQQWAGFRDGKAAFGEEERRFVRKDGSVFWGEITMTIAPDPRGGARYAVAALQDITARRQSDERLRETQKLESVGLLAGGVAHDFNNLLTGILGNASLLIEDLPPRSANRRMLETVIASAERAAQLTRDLLAYAGKGQFVMEKFDLSELVRESYGILRPSVPPNVEFRLETSRQSPAIRADRLQIQHLLANLVINAVEAIADGEHGFITVSTGTMRLDGDPKIGTPQVGNLAPGLYAFLRVEDTGTGIEEALQSRIFDPFFSTKFTGRGLGLASVAGIVRSQKGAVLVDSKPGNGSAFTCLFPAVETGPAAATGKGPSRAAEADAIRT